VVLSQVIIKSESWIILIFSIIYFKKHGVEKSLGIGKITDYEQKLIQVAVKELQANIQKGVKFVNEQYRK
jgi:malate dehydrogenase